MIANKKVIDKNRLDIVIEDLRHLAFAEYFKEGDRDFSDYDKGGMLARVQNEMTALIERTLLFAPHKEGRTAIDLTLRFMERLPDTISLLHSDVEAAFDGDPAADSYAEIIVAYPGLYTISVQRFAHILYEIGVPILPRLMTEMAHSKTGIDIHPGAVIGERFFIDHGTGIVIGETAVIGNNVKIYHGVTLGAMTTRKGQQLKGLKRHPSIGSNVTIYANATVLGGDTYIGSGSTLAGGSLVTHSMPD
jgi:serine O-acetyltransferase